MREKQKAERVGAAGGSEGEAAAGVGAGGGALWPPLRPASAPPTGAGDPRALCASGKSILHTECRVESTSLFIQMSPSILDS